MTADGRGDFEALTVSLFNRNKKYPLKKIYSSTSSDSLGYFYGRITGLLGFKPMAHEGKITGLAAYGNPKKALPLMKKMIKVKNGELTASLGDWYKPFFKGYSKKLINEEGYTIKGVQTFLKKSNILKKKSYNQEKVYLDLIHEIKKDISDIINN